MEELYSEFETFLQGFVRYDSVRTKSGRIRNSGSVAVFIRETIVKQLNISPI